MADSWCSEYIQYTLQRLPPLSPALRPLQLTEIWEQRYEQRGIDSSYLFRVDDEWVVSASRGIAGSTGIPCLVQRVADEGVFLVK